MFNFIKISILMILALGIAALFSVRCTDQNCGLFADDKALIEIAKDKKAESSEDSGNEDTEFC